MAERREDSSARGVGSVAPATEEIYRVTAERTEQMLTRQGQVLRDVSRLILATDRHILAEQPATLWPVVVIRSCVSAGGDWRRARWPAVALELAMTAADVFDDIADGEETRPIARFGRGPVLTAAVGLLSLAESVILQATDDGCAESVAVQLGRLLGNGIATAADAQARGLASAGTVTDVGEAYRLAAEKSGPLGELAARLGAAVATTDADALDLYAAFGWHFAVAGQLVNDAWDVAPEGPTNKRDLRDGSPTVPLVFTRSSGAPRGLGESALKDWEVTERRRVADEGGVALAEVLVIADRLRAEQALLALDRKGHATQGLRGLLSGSRSGG